MTMNYGPESSRLRQLRSKSVRLTMAAALAVASVSTLRAAFQDAPPAKPDNREGQRGDRREGERDRGSKGSSTRPSWRGFFNSDRGYAPAGPRRESWRDVPVPSDEEWQEVEDFMRENSPSRLQVYEKFEAERGADHPMSQGIRKRSVARYRELINLRDSGSVLYPFAITQYKIEDAVLATLTQIRRVGETAELQAQRDKLVHDFVQNSLKERQARLEKLKELVSRETEMLESDRADMAKLEERQQERFEREMHRMVDFATDTEAPTTKPDGQ